MFIVFAYISALVLANLLVAWLGPWFSPVNAFFLIGLDLILRDFAHDKWSGKNLMPKMAGMIVVAGAVSYWLNPATELIAIASITSFVAAMTADSVAYQALKNRPWMQRTNGSNAVSAVVDSILFPTIAFGVIMPHIVALQFICKTAGGFFWSWLLQKMFTKYRLP